MRLYIVAAMIKMQIVAMACPVSTKTRQKFPQLREVRKSAKMRASIAPLPSA